MLEPDYIGPDDHAGSPAVSAPEEPRPPTVLKFRSASGRTEIAHRPDGTVSLHVLGGSDVLTPHESGDASWAIGAAKHHVHAVALDQAIAEHLHDPLFARAWMEAHMRETERREQAAFERGKAEGIAEGRRLEREEREQEAMARD